MSSGTENQLLELNSDSKTSCGLQHKPPCSPSSFSSSSSSFDAKIWEELHLNSLVSDPSFALQSAMDSRLFDMKENTKSKNSNNFSSPRLSSASSSLSASTESAKLLNSSMVSSPPRLSNATSSTTLSGTPSGRLQNSPMASSPLHSTSTDSVSRWGKCKKSASLSSSPFRLSNCSNLSGSQFAKCQNSPISSSPHCSANTTHSAPKCLQVQNSSVPSSPCYFSSASCSTSSGKLHNFDASPFDHSSIARGTHSGPQFSKLQTSCIASSTCVPNSATSTQSGGKNRNVSSHHRLTTYSGNLLSKQEHSRAIGACLDQQLPVLQVIQAGSMSFTSEQLLVFQPGNNSLETSMENSNLTSDDKKDDDSDYKTNEGGFDDDSSKPKFLLLTPPADFFSSPLGSSKPAGTVPFKWEEVPGIAKPCTDLVPAQELPSLQLPPRLLPRPDISSFHSPKSQSKPSLWSNVSPRKTEDFRTSSTRNLWQTMMERGRRSYQEDRIRVRRMSIRAGDEDSWSPTSILFGPDAGRRDASSSSSTSSVFDLSPAISESLDKSVTGDRSAALLVDGNLSFPVPDLAPPRKRDVLRRLAGEGVKGILKICRLWRSSSSEKKSNHQENGEIWAPTLGTYFHSMELGRNSIALLAENTTGSSSDVQSVAEIGRENQISAAICSPKAFEDDDGAFQACDGVFESSTEDSCSPTDRKVSSSSAARKPRRWVLRKLRRGSRFLVAIWRAVKRSVISRKSKRRKLDYQHLTGLD